MKKLLITLTIVLGGIFYTAAFISCVTETPQTQVMETVEEPKQTTTETIFDHDGFQQSVRTFTYINEQGVQYRVFIYGNGVDEAGLFVINESLQKEQLEYYSKLH